MSDVTVIQGRYSCDVVNIVVGDRTARNAVKRKRKHPATKYTRTKTSITTIKPTSVVTKNLSRLLHTIENADDTFTILSACLDEKSPLLEEKLSGSIRNDNADNSKNHHHKSQQPSLSICDLFTNEVNNEVRQRKLNKKCSGWKYETKHCITAMSNAVEISVYTHIKQQQQQQKQRARADEYRSEFRSSAPATATTASANGSRSSTPCRANSRHATPCRTIPTETLLLSSKDSFDSAETTSNFARPTSASTDTVSVLIAPTSTKLSSPLLQNAICSDSEEDEVRHVTVPTMLSHQATTPNTRLANSHLYHQQYQHHHSVLEHATAANFVSDDSEMDTATTINHDLQTSTSSMTIAMKKSATPIGGSGQSIPNHIEMKSFTEDEIQLQNFWSQFLEYVQFYITAYTMGKQQQQQKSNTTKKSSIYDIYKLAEPIQLYESSITVSNQKVNHITDLNSTRDKIRSTLLTEFRSLYQGITSGNVSRKGRSEKNGEDDYDGIGINAIFMNENDLWLQIYINASFNLEWKASPVHQQPRRNIITEIKKSKNHMELIVLIPFCVTHQQYVAISSSRMKSKTKYVSYALSAIEGTFACTASKMNNSFDATGLDTEESDDSVLSCKKSITTHCHSTTPRYEKYLSGINPYALFRSLNGQLKTTSKYDESDAGISQQQNDPIHGLYTAATGCLYDDGRTSSLRKRRSQDDNESNEDVKGGNSPLSIRTTIRWDWKGTTNAPLSCWGPMVMDHDVTAQTCPQMNHPFKCRVTMTGTNVATGIQSLMDYGYMKKKNISSSVPYYIQAVTKESQSLLLFGNDNKKDTICVENGDILLSRK